ncbi:MAG TPA: hypothetical protein VGP38_02945 [Rubrobacter sp.]|nr:hypothetical protein [Rubrobacter sp.]
MSTGTTNLKRLAVGAAAASLLAFGGVAYAQQQGAATPQDPGARNHDCQREQSGERYQGSPQT